MANTVQVDFIADGKQVFATADEIKAKIKALSDSPAAKSLPLTALNNQLETLKNNAIETRRQLESQIRLNVFGKPLDAASVAAQKLLAETKEIQRQVAGIKDTVESGTLTSPAVVQRLRGSASGLSGNLDDVNERIPAVQKAADKEVEIVEKAAGRIKIIRGFGALFRVTGLTALGINEAEINAGINLYNKYIEKTAAAAAAAKATVVATTAASAAESTAVGATAATATAAATASETAAAAATVANTEAAAAITILGAPLAALGALVAVGATAIIAVKVGTDALAQSAARRLLSEELITKEYGRQQKAIFDLKKDALDFQRQEEAAQKGREFDASTQESTEAKDKTALELKRNSLQRNLDLVEKYRALNKQTLGGTNPEDDARAKLLREEISKTNAALFNIDQANAKFRQPDSAADFQKRQKDAADAAEKEAKKQEEAAQKRIDDANRLKDQYEKTFDSLQQKANADNPFVKIWTDADKALIELRKNLKGVSPELLAIAENLQRKLNADALFNARIDNVLSVSDLRQQSSFFRNGQKAETPDDLLKRLGFKPDEFKAFTDAQKLGLANQFGVNQRLGFSDASANGRFNNVSLDTLFRGSAANARQRQSTEETVQQRLDRQFKELSTLRPGDETQRAAIDRRVASLAANADPTTLRQDTRNQVADALERAADRAAKQQSDASDAINANTKALNMLTEVYNNQVKNGVDKGEVKVTFNSDTPNATAQITPPTPNDSRIGFGSF